MSMLPYTIIKLNTVNIDLPSLSKTVPKISKRLTESCRYYLLLVNLGNVTPSIKKKTKYRTDSLEEAKCCFYLKTYFYAHLKHIFTTYHIKTMK